MKKIVFIMLLILVGVGAFFAWKMLKGDGGCCGWGGDNTDPWSSYTPPAEETRRLRRPDLKLNVTAPGGEAGSLVARRRCA